MKARWQSIQSKLSRDELESEFRACLAFAFVAIVTLYSVLSISEA